MSEIHDTSSFFISSKIFILRIFIGDFYSSDDTEFIRRHSCYRITHGFSRIFGLWPMAGARKVLLIFFVTQISLMAQIFLRGNFLSHRFHRFSQIFMESLVNRFVFIGLRGVIGTFLLSDYSRIFTDIWPLANGWRPKGAAIGFVTQISQMTQIFLRGNFLSHRFHRFSQIFMESLVNRLVHLQGVSVSTEQVASAKIRE